MNKDLFKLPKITNKGPQGSQESPVPAQSQKSAKFNNRPGANRFGGHDRRTVVTPKAKVVQEPDYYGHLFGLSCKEQELRQYIFSNLCVQFGL